MEEGGAGQGKGRWAARKGQAGARESWLESGDGGAEGWTEGRVRVAECGTRVRSVMLGVKKGRAARYRMVWWWELGKGTSTDVRGGLGLPYDWVGGALGCISHPPGC